MEGVRPDRNRATGSTIRMSLRNRRFCFTWNNYSEEELQSLKESLEKMANSGSLTYAGIGEEVGASGTCHLQGCLSFRHPRKFGSVRELLRNKAHLEVAKGSMQQNREYCSKEGKYWEVGAVTSQGKSSEMMQLKELIDSGGTLSECWEKHFSLMMRHRASANAYHSLVNQPKPCSSFSVEDFPSTWAIDLDVNRSLIFWGPSGIGKTQYALALLPGALFVSHMDSLANFDASQHSGIIFDDMSFNHLHREAQIHLVDYDQPRDIHVRYKTAQIPANTKKIFTTNVEKGRIFDIDDPAIKRRLKIHYLDKII